MLTLFLNETPLLMLMIWQDHRQQQFEQYKEGQEITNVYKWMVIKQHQHEAL